MEYGTPSTRCLRRTRHACFPAINDPRLLDISRVVKKEARTPIPCKVSFPHMYMKFYSFIYKLVLKNEPLLMI